MGEVSISIYGTYNYSSTTGIETNWESINKNDKYEFLIKYDGKALYWIPISKTHVEFYLLESS